jgi:exosome complex RNA-binding protein Csl4
VTGIGRSGNTISSTEIMLLGRQVGSTPGSSSTGQSVEGIVRQIAAADNRFTIETTDRRLLTVYGTSATPVNYQGRAYRISNLEVGDRVRVQVESSTSEAVRARSVDVIADVRGADGRTLTSVYGRVTRIDTRAQTLRIDAGAREVRVDARNARDSEGRTFRLSDIRVGDSIEVSGSFDAADTFRADTIRFGDGSAVTGGGIRNPGPTVVERPVTRGYETFVIYGTVEREIGSEETLLVRDSDSDRELEVYLLDDFVVRLVNGSYVTADQLEEGTRVVIQAFRDRDGFYIAQTIRTR